MSYTGRTKTATLAQLATSATSLLAASATQNFYIRQFHAANTTASASSWSVAIAATVTAANALFFTKAIAAFSIDQIFFSPGLQVINTQISALAGNAATVNMVMTYDAEVI